MEKKLTVDQTAHNLVRGERAATYGPPHTNFEVIARMWDEYLRPRLRVIITEAMRIAIEEEGDADADDVLLLYHKLVDENDVCNLMTLLKLAREASGQGYHKDSTVDAIGYQIIKEILNMPLDQFLKEMKS